MNEDANQQQMNLISELKSNNDVIRLLKDENMDSSKENMKLLLGELKIENSSLQNPITQYETDKESCTMNLTSKSALKDDIMDETIIEGLKAELQDMEWFLPTTTRDSNNNIKKTIHVSSAVKVQQSFSIALTI